ncbi:MAG: NUDIX hydrolase [Pseudomonadota bacterium]
MTDPEFVRQVPDGDDRERRVCGTCGFIDYQNPRVVVGSVVDVDGDVLLCRRAIEPRKGYWTLPAGFLELGETVEEGALREAREEACCTLDITGVLAVYSVPRIGQVQVMHMARLAAPGYAAGPESEEVAVFRWDDIPWDDLAFPTVHWALRQARQVWGTTGFVPFGNPDGERGDLTA